jgi:hypothetical protein
MYDNSRQIFLTGENIVNICVNCVGEDYLKSVIKGKKKKGKCAYCKEKDFIISLEELSEIIEIAFKTHYQITPIDPDEFEYIQIRVDEDYVFERRGQPIVDAIIEEAEISEKAADDIQEILEGRNFNSELRSMGEEGEFSEDMHYERIDSGDPIFNKEWDYFEHQIKYQVRFYGDGATKTLMRIFGDIDKIPTKANRALTVEAGPGTNYSHLYRARVFQSKDKFEAALIRPDKEMSSPPSQFAASGRMNARGISVFYGATSPAISIAEVRPPVGSNVIVAKFDIVRSLKLLDLTAFSEVEENGSIFDPEYTYRLGRARFLQTLTERISRPIMPDDQDFEYLATQAIADFLATGSLQLDGIIYPCRQVSESNNGLNVVLFHKAARCREIFPEGTKFTLSLPILYQDDYFDPEEDYTIVEEIPRERKEPRQADHDPLRYQPESPNHDKRIETLLIDIESVSVYKINSVSFGSKEFKVRRDKLREL